MKTCVSGTIATAKDDFAFMFSEKELRKLKELGGLMGELIFEIEWGNKDPDKILALNAKICDFKIPSLRLQRNARELPR